ncbi:hypothetical protein [Archangium sp.]|jgi:hypothetical protein|uniref:hypothetical protein n=1 Tax=Archangium sp. TaxID=1872627 RepID=UPI002ED9C12C
MTTGPDQRLGSNICAPMRAFVLPASLAFLVALTLREPPGWAREERTRTRYTRILVQGGRYFLGHKVVRLLAFELALSNALAWGIIWLFQPLLERSGMPLRFFGVVHALVGFTFSLPRIPLFSAYINHHIPSEQRATVLSFVSMVRTLGIVVCNPFIGLLAEWSLSWTMAILGTGLIVLAAASRLEERHLVTPSAPPDPTAG